MKVFVYSDSGLQVIDGRTLEEAIAEKKQEISRRATSCIENAGIDLITQLNAIAGIYEPERCEAIKDYIAACRNEYLRCKGLILAATTNEAADSVQFQPPSVPENL